MKKCSNCKYFKYSHFCMGQKGMPCIEHPNYVVCKSWKPAKLKVRRIKKSDKV